MFKQIILPILAVVAFIVLVGIFVQKSGSLNLSKYIYPSPSAEKSATIGSKTISLTIADTPEKRTQGLSGVSSLDKDSGMLFIFDSKGVSPIFWMKDMLIPIDTIWIKDGKIVKIDKNMSIPAPGTPDSGLKQYTAQVPIDYVLEVNAGFCDANSIKVGDEVKLSGI